MFDDDGQGPQRVALAIVFGIVALLVASLIAFGVHKRNVGVKAPAPVTATSSDAGVAPAATPASAAQTAQAVADSASVMVEQGVVKFYFASGKADLAAGANEVLADLVKAAKSGKRIVVSGFHDATGDAEKNAALARQRAMAVRDALVSAGVPQNQIELKKPELTTGAGSNAEARRVEISVR